MRKKRTDVERADLARKVLDAAYLETESWREGSIGADLAYLVHAILMDDFVLVERSNWDRWFDNLFLALQGYPVLWADVKDYVLWTDTVTSERP